MHFYFTRHKLNTGILLCLSTGQSSVQNNVGAPHTVPSMHSQPRPAPPFANQAGLITVAPTGPPAPPPSHHPMSPPDPQPLSPIVTQGVATSTMPHLVRGAGLPHTVVCKYCCVTGFFFFLPIL